MKTNKQRIRYTKAPKWVDEAFGSSEPIDPSTIDLPSPEEFACAQKRDEKQRITILLDTAAVTKFKKYATTHGLKYQSLINDIVSTYAKKNL